MTRTPRSVARLLTALEAAGCTPWPAGDRAWFAPCPTCRLEGRESIVEIRASDVGVIVACVTAHEPPAADERSHSEQAGEVGMTPGGSWQEGRVPVRHPDSCQRTSPFGQSREAAA